MQIMKTTRATRSSIASVFANVALLLFLSTPALARPVGCGETFTGSGELRESCSGDVVIQGGVLDLDGHTLTGTVRCEGDLCEIVSDPPNGTIRGSAVAGSHGIVSGEGARESAGAVRVDSVIVTGFATGIAAASVQLSHSLVAGNLGHGVDAAGAIEAVDSIVSLNGGNGLHSRLRGVSLRDCRVTENFGSGVRALQGVIVVRSTISENAADGIENYAARAVVVESEVTGNGRHGVRSDDSDCDPANGLEMVASRSTDNGTSVECGDTVACADLISCAAPVLRSASVCGTSQPMMSMSPAASWRVCSSD